MAKNKETDLLNLDFKKIGRNIKEERLRNGFTHEELAHKAGLSSVHISHIEAGSSKMGLESFARICHALGVNPDQILLGHIYTANEYLRDDIANTLKQFNDKELDMASKILKTYLENK